METEKEKPIMLPELCDKHQQLLVHQAHYAKSDPWQALLIASNVVLFQVATCGDRLHKKVGGDLHRIREVGCLACFQPDVFGQIVEAAKTHDLGKVKAIADRCIEKNQGVK